MQFALSIVLLLAATPFTRGHPVLQADRDQQDGLPNFQLTPSRPLPAYSGEVSAWTSHSRNIHSPISHPPTYSTKEPADPLKPITPEDVARYINTIPEAWELPTFEEIRDVHPLGGYSTMEWGPSIENASLLERIKKVCKKGCTKVRKIFPGAFVLTVLIATFAAGVYTGIYDEDQRLEKHLKDPSHGNGK